MPARWVDLLQRILNVLDDADRDLSDSEHTLLMDETLRRLITRRHNRRPRSLRHPTPRRIPAPTRNVTGQ